MADDAAARQSTPVRKFVHGSNALAHGGVPRTGVLVLADGTVFFGDGFGAEGEAAASLCFHTEMGGFQEVLTDPATAGRIVTFTFPQVGASGVNAEDMESGFLQAAGCVLGAGVTRPSNFRSEQGFDAWLQAAGRIGLSGVDTRAITRHIGRNGTMQAVIAHAKNGAFDLEALRAKAAAPATAEAAPAQKAGAQAWQEGGWTLGKGYASVSPAKGAPHVVVLDLGVRRTLLRQLVDAGLKVTVVAASTDFAALGQLGADGLLVSSGAANPANADPALLETLRQWIDGGKPLLAVALGHQLLARALGAETRQLPHGQHGANHPVKRLADGKLQITSVNHDFVVDADTLPDTATPTSISLFDESSHGFELAGRPVFSVQHYPLVESDPNHPFHRFVASLGKVA